MRCSVCANEQVNTIDTLLEAGTSLRALSRMVGHSRSALSRHKAHAQLTGSKLGVIRDEGVPDGTDGSLDPLGEALRLARKARSDRQLLKAAEAVRAATALQVRALGDLDPETLERLHANVAEAATLYRRVSGFENELRGLAGHREAIKQKLSALRPSEITPTLIDLQFTAIGSDPPEAPAVLASPDDRDIPPQYRDPRYDVWRMITLSFGKGASTSVKVYEGDVLVWKEE